MGRILPALIALIICIALVASALSASTLSWKFTLDPSQLTYRETAPASCRYGSTDTALSSTSIIVAAVPGRELPRSPRGRRLFVPPRRARRDRGHSAKPWGSIGALHASTVRPPAWPSGRPRPNRRTDSFRNGRSAIWARTSIAGIASPTSPSIRSGTT